MISRLDVVNAYQQILGRDPESEEAIDAHLRQGYDRQGMRMALLCSQEFNQFYRRVVWQDSRALLSKEDLSDRKLIFLHIPKTGGTTLHEILSSNYRPEEVCPEKFNKIADYRSGELAGYRLFSGHFDGRSVQLIPGLNKKLITIFREPKARLVSFYYFLRSHRVEYLDDSELLPIFANKYSFLDFLQCHELVRTRNIFNPYIQLLVSEKPSGLYVMDGPRVVLNKHDSELLEEAKLAVDSLDAFGVLEYYENSVKYILDKLGYPVPKVINNKMVLSDLERMDRYKKVEKEAITESHERLIMDNTYLDQYLYQYVLERFTKNCEE